MHIIKKNDFCPYLYRKKVNWFDNTINRQDYSIPLQNTLRSSLTVFKVSQIQEVLKSLDLVDESINHGIQNRLINQKTIYSSIKNTFLNLNSTEFELLVSYVLRSLGFEATQETGHVGDGGIDFEGVLNVMGISSTNLQVQVKRYENSSINRRMITEFRGSLKSGFQGCFITLSKFAKPAIKEASDSDKIVINTINGYQFIDIFVEQYDKIIELIYADDNDDFAEKLKFKKALFPII